MGAELQASGLPMPTCRRRVIYVLPYLGVGGTEMHVLHLVSGIRWARPPVVVAPDGALRRAFEGAGAQVRVFTDPTGKWLAGVRSFRRALLRALEPEQPGARGPAGGSEPSAPVIHVHSAAELLWLARRWARNARFVFTDHGYFGRGAALSYRIAAALLRSSGVPLITVSALQRSLWVGPLRMRADRVRTIPNGVPDPMACTPDVPPPPWASGPGPVHLPAASSSGLSPLAPAPPAIVGAVGRLEPQKGFTYLLDAFERIAPHFAAARLVVVGDGSLRATLESRIASSPVLRERVTLAGQVAMASSWMRYFTLFCLPSLAEALPLTLIEAMASGCPIVATQVGGVPEALGGGTAGILVPPGDPQALASGLEQLLQDAALRERLGRSARQRYEERFTHTAMARAVAELYARL